jgi:formylglycine-generating enzyme required for sulfatase activity
VCNGAGGRRCNAQPVTPQPEICDGLDNDCDGKVDEIESEANRTSDERLVYFAARNVTMFAYEASRYDATATNVGFDSTARPCSVAGRQPWASITKEDAAAACARVGTGWRLCTRDEWFDACNGSANSTFPYGNTYSMTACVGYDYTAPQPNTQPAATGSATMCVSDLSTAAGDELFDMSGNVKEWVLTTVSPAAYEMRGGAYDIASFVETTGRKAPGMECAASTGAPTQPVRLPALGFRCCLPGRLPAN